MTVYSPITGSSNTEMTESIPARQVIDKYFSEYNVDVSKYFEDISSINIFKCLDTGYRFYYPFSLSGDEDLYSVLQHNEGYYRYKWEHRFAETYIKLEETVLEIGCGEGIFLKSLEDKGILARGIELNRSAAAKGIKKGLKISCELLSQHSCNSDSYDVVCCFQVLEHIHMVKEFIEDCLSKLNPGGKLIIGVPNCNPYLYKFDKFHTLNLPPHHMGLWDVNSLKNLANFYDMKLDSIHVQPMSDWEYQYQFELQLKHAKVFSRFFAFFMLKGLHLLPPNSNKTSRSLIGGLMKGRNILAVYEKEKDVT